MNKISKGRGSGSRLQHELPCIAHLTGQSADYTLERKLEAMSVSSTLQLALEMAVSVSPAFASSRKGLVLSTASAWNHWSLDVALQLSIVVNFSLYATRAPRPLLLFLANGLLIASQELPHVLFRSRAVTQR